ncbi:MULTISPECIES: PEP-CTERM sorting domain-containing protein [unclassified Lentimonas]|uniref:PEP-CTERM sorting domain-containing protein n=1 Tax=unclassified Lentimonas TaxID=2630993 RepID=UPI001326AC31|nr:MULTISPECIES: PEP-CTERM sorting domain-containing protein [unclassified Lentimonas]CAA6676684.1 Unannotated [Lentimonas sp. CC4]CAA6684652.1 Unannotated [Lentimonas sp. CC6]CAA7075287.1 Unannotated [Lentimonas sp. CC4]CAA7170673.1 Unannotated [Lentimonas sp. CC21]CAA7182304.1 Unannotated [Lentimonas sp. CC8]
MKLPILFISFITVGTSLNAAINITITEAGGDVVMESTGSLTVSPTIPAPLYTSPQSGKLRSALGELAVGLAQIADTNFANINIYSDAIVSGPSNFGGSLTLTTANTSTGNYFEMIGLTGSTAIALDGQLVNESALTVYNTVASSTWNSATFTSLGLTTGTYIWTTDARFGNDTITLTVVPEPSNTALLLSAGILAVVGLRRRR